MIRTRTLGKVPTHAGRKEGKEFIGPLSAHDKWQLDRVRDTFETHRGVINTHVYRVNYSLVNRTLDRCIPLVISIT